MKKYKQHVSRENPMADRVDNNLGSVIRSRLLRLERRLADYLNSKCSELSGRILLFGLIAFCVVVTLICLGLVLGRIK